MFVRDRLNLIFGFHESPKLRENVFIMVEVWQDIQAVASHNLHQNPLV